MYDTLLFLHVLSAFALGAGLVILTAVVLRARVPAGAVTLADRLWDIGGLGTLVFGVWLAFYVDGYEIWDGWIVAALVLWGVSAFAATRSRVRARRDEDVMPAGPNRGALVREPIMHWVAAAATVALLADMIWKPGAGP